MKKFLRRALFAVLTLLLLALVGAWLFVRSKKPVYDGSLRLPGLAKEVEVLYDEHGIPHIYAQNETDAYCALGYVHAQDRLFQMEILRRLADGRLSEIVGEKALETDKFFRTMSFRKHARETLAAAWADPNAPALLAAEAYYRGVNEFVKNGTTPLEFDLMGIPKRPFSVEDGLMASGYMALSFCHAFDGEPINSFVLQKLGADYLADWQTGWDSAATKIPVFPATAAPEKNADDAKKLSQLLDLQSMMGRVREFCTLTPPFLGSNSVVLGPSRTQSGKPIFENDTHIAFSQPPVWYEAHLNYGENSIYGNFIAGAPVPVLGHTKAGAWGMTMFLNDDVDFYRETLNPANPNQVRFGETWENLDIRYDTILVKDAVPVVFPVKRSRHGYFVNEIVKTLQPETHPIAFWWVYHLRPDRLMQVFYDISHARKAQEVAAACAQIHAPGLNVMWADTLNNIAWWASGLLPKRPAHVKPYLMLNGASGKDEIEGWLSFDHNPQSLNPPSGFVYTCNNQPARMGADELVPGYYVPEDRARRMNELLADPAKKWSAAEVRQLTADVQNPICPKVLAAVLPLLESKCTEPTAQAVLKNLKNWTGSHGLQETAPTVYYRFLWRFYRNTFRDELSEPVFASLQKSQTLKRSLENFIQNDRSRWWDDISTPNQQETRAQILEKSFREALADLQTQLGADPNTWHWGKVHSLTHNHPLGILPLVGSYFNVGPFPAPGGKETINNLDFPMDSTGIYRVRSGPALRRVFDFAAPEEAMSINPSGQSGVLGSRFYGDQAKMYVDGVFRHEWRERPDVERVRTGRLLLQPN